LLHQELPGVLHRRRKKYTTRLIVPRDLRDLMGRNEFWRALDSENRVEAQTRADQLKGRAATMWSLLRREGSRMTPDQIAALVDHYLSTELDAIDLRLATGEWRANGHEWNDTAQDVLVEQIETMTDDLATNNLRPTFDLAHEMLPSASSETLLVLARRLLEARLQATEAELRALQGQPLPRPRPAHASPQVAHESASRPAGPKLSTVIDRYVAFQREGNAWAPKTDKSVTGILGALLGLIGDRPMTSITKDDMRALRTLLTRVPTHAVKRYRGLSLIEAADAADKEGNDERLSPKSRNIYITWTRTLWKWAIEQDLIKDNPTTALKDFNEDEEQNQRNRFTAEEIAAFLSHLDNDRDAEPAHYWVPRIMLTSGLRLEEAAKLRPCDIQERDGIVFFDINQDAGRLKKPWHARIVPVHSALLAVSSSLVLPVIEWAKKVEQQKGAKANLWQLSKDAHGRWSEKLSKRLNTRLRAAGITDRKTVMESARNTFADELKQAEVGELVIADLMGHRAGVTESGRRYVKVARLALLKNTVEKIARPLG
jgi:integrase